MVLEVGSLNRSTLEPFKTWRFERTGREDDIDIDVEAGIFSSLVPRHCSSHEGPCSIKEPGKPGHGSAESQLRQCLELLATPSSTDLSALTRSRVSTSSSHSSLSFTFDKPHKPPDFDFPLTPCPLRLEKRRRAHSDVDGPYTAALSCKKRRLRLHLITSRLSQPFSLPATHIINRDGAASGDKRFVKLAAVATSPDPSKQGLNREGSVMLRAAVLNRVRIRVRNEATQRGDLVVAAAAANAAVLHHGQQLATGARFVAPPSTLAEQQKRQYQEREKQQHQPPPRVILMRPGGFNAPGSSNLSTQSERRPSPPITPQSARVLPKSPRLHPTRSPVLAPCETMLDEMDDDGTLAFPMSDQSCHYAWADEDDSEDVYSDFGAIFGGSAQTAQDDDDGSYEEYLDELDGISWVER
ncbi:hypothetical protein CMUS01_02165 [Colletotrichum musicola]|uniref:Uncharacterized protein n=1 Tax=Colletotrichum musicola TaxID=2175873 RepID=A0A8H6NVP7_9PEZI|nr:hypothetical protein CMUS01_02165 [Colletotrichum musicola]